jgi:hypothetical protein
MTLAQRGGGSRPDLLELRARLVVLLLCFIRILGHFPRSAAEHSAATVGRTVTGAHGPHATRGHARRPLGGAAAERSDSSVRRAARDRGAAGTRCDSADGSHGGQSALGQACLRLRNRCIHLGTLLLHGEYARDVRPCNMRACNMQPCNMQPCNMQTCTMLTFRTYTSRGGYCMSHGACWMSMTHVARCTLSLTHHAACLDRLQLLRLLLLSRLRVLRVCVPLLPLLHRALSCANWPEAEYSEYDDSASPAASPSGGIAGTGPSV